MSARRRSLLAAGAAVAALGVAAAALAQSASGNYDLSWRSLTGGGHATGGSYAADAAIGQAVTGTSSGGAYSVSSGFLAGGAEKYRRYLPILSKDGSN